MVKELLVKFNALLCQEGELLGKTLPGRDEDEEAAAASCLAMEEAFCRFRELEDGYLRELMRLAADEAKKAELLPELVTLRELHRRREKNIALGRMRLGLLGKEMNRVQKEKRAHFAYSPAKKRKDAGFVDSKI